MAAQRLFKRVMRHYCYMQIYEKKKSNLKFFTHKGLSDDDLFLDLKLDLDHSMADKKLFDLSDQARGPDEIGSRASLAKGLEYEKMPYFVTTQFKTIFD